MGRIRYGARSRGAARATASWRRPRSERGRPRFTAIYETDPDADRGGAAAAVEPTDEPLVRVTDRHRRHRSGAARRSAPARSPSRRGTRARSAATRWSCR